MSYKIITDSSCDFTAKEYAELGLAFAALSIHDQGSTTPSFTEPEDLHNFYESIRAGAMPTTSAVNPEGWTAVMKPILEQGQDVLCLAFSSGLSATYQSAVIAAEELQEKFPDRKIRVVDTLCAAYGQGLLVWYACQKRNSGMALEEVAAWVEENRLHLAHWFTVDDLNHLKRGGRVSATTAFVGGLLNIKPMLRLDDEGKLETMDKVRGRKASMEYLLKKAQTTCTDFSQVFIGHGDCPEDAQKLAEMARAVGFQNVRLGYVGGVIGAHTGPGVLVCCFLASQR